MKGSATISFDRIHHIGFEETSARKSSGRTKAVDCAEETRKIGMSIKTSVVAIAVIIATAGAPAAASGLGRGWRGSSVGAISRNVITPYYVGYYGGHYSYYKPDPIRYWPYVADPDYRCWRWPYWGYRFKVC
jgi:hypothetical protein